MVPWPSDQSSAELGPALVTLLRKCERLRSLALGAADKDAGSVRVELQGFADALASHVSLTFLDVAALKLEDEVIAEVAATLHLNATLLHLTLPPSCKGPQAMGTGISKGPQAMAADATIRSLLDRNRSIAARTPRPALPSGSAAASVPSVAAEMPTRTEQFKGMANLELPGHLPLVPTAATPGLAAAHAPSSCGAVR